LRGNGAKRASLRNGILVYETVVDERLEDLVTRKEAGMAEYIMAGVDVHDDNLLAKIAADKSEEETRHFCGGLEGQRKLVAELKRWKKRHRAKRVVVAYEASGAGLGLYDRLTDAGIECRLMAPSCMPRSDKQRRQRNDDRDALMLLEQLRGHFLAGNNLYDCWVPDKETRDDRELVRARLDAASKVTQLKAQVQMMLKRHSIRKPEEVGGNWTKSHWRWLFGLAEDGGGRLGSASRLALKAYLRQLQNAEEEVCLLEDAVAELAQSDRYRAQAEALTGQIKGVGVIVAMVFLVEVGDMTRFSNRKQIASYLGIVPTSNESSDGDDRKGHITHRGPWRVRTVLCQAAWAAVRCDATERAVHERICAKNPRHRKIGIVAVMRRISIRMWHVALETQPEEVFAEAQKPTVRKKQRRKRRRGASRSKKHSSLVKK
jgi:transposase